MMTAPIYMAAPPEVHSTLLSSGPGPGSLLEAAGAWSSLSAEYTSVAEELSSVLAEVQTGAWEGPSAESFVSAYVPYLAWLAKASADSAAAATQHETAAAAYAAALAAMPTMPELATNHVVHGVLQATNFFGINTIPIAVNEADYARMWVQAATTMSTYEAVADTAVAATPTTDVAPPILKSNDAQPADSTNPDGGSNAGNPLGIPQWLQQFLQQFGIGNEQLAHDPMVDTPLDDAIAQWLQNFGYNWQPGQGLLNGATYDTYTNPGQASYWVARALELTEDFQYFGQLLQTNPVQAIQWFISWQLFDFPTHILQVTSFLAENPALFVALAPASLTPLAAGAGLAGLGALAQPVIPMLPIESVAAPPLFPVTAPAAPAVLASSVAPSAPAPSPTPAPAASTPAAPTPPTAPAPPAAGPGFTPPYVVGGPTIGSSLSARAKTQEPTSRGASKAPEAAAAAAASAAKKPTRRRRRATHTDQADEFADMNIDVDPNWVPSTEASEHGAGPLGFAGTVPKGGEQATGLATLTDDGFGSGPTMPMLPGTWSPEDSTGNGSGN
jgi:PPE-repeat protein